MAEDAFCLKSAPAGTGREGRNGRKDGSGRVGEGRGGRGNKHTRFKTCGAAHGKTGEEGRKRMEGKRRRRDRKRG